MPTYDYECAKCGHTFDAFQSMSDDPLKKCPECSQNALKRLIGGGLGVIFKGSGFYVTDSRSGGSKKGSSKKDSGGDSSAAPASTGEAASASGTNTSGDSGSGKKDGSKSSDKSTKVAT